MKKNKKEELEEHVFKLISNCKHFFKPLPVEDIVGLGPHDNTTVHGWPKKYSSSKTYCQDCGLIVNKFSVSYLKSKFK